ncbi:sigma-70 family RNA polymerase sigma factor [Bacillus infantis]|uniref:Sigma-70 family RNA polymerase sigma factor n=1 Tax=Bacillus infantis TaxID=324767 RepID=A0A5D4SSC6_9BACI|nr:sigma-70 family RNA polymerase sigma factor [Bacillus infantis]TYS65138.1 sigma-70 family RNA polymerase sigma factor [Bacillus infantis]
MSRSNDSLLYEKILRKDKQALEDLYDKYEKILFSFLYKMTEDRDLSEEALQEVFLKIWRGKGHYTEDKGKFSSWLFTMARNTAIDIIRKKEKGPVPVDEIQPAASLESSAEEQTEWKEERMKVHSAVSKLSEDQKGIIDLIYFKGFTQQKISKSCNIPLGTVKSRARLALRNLRKFLDAAEGREKA